MLRTLEGLPPGGWRFREAATGWQLPFGTNFTDSVNAVIRQRELNPRLNLPTDFESVSREVQLQTEHHIRSLGRGAIEHYLIDSDPKPSRPQPQPSPLPDPSAAGVGKASLRVSIPVVLNWLGEGLKPVDAGLAAGRAAICAKCPRNRPGGWQHWFTGPVSNMLKMQMELKHEMQAATPSDDQLNVCDACLCELKLKVWTPIQHITNNTNEETYRRLDPGCWILKEK